VLSYALVKKKVNYVFDAEIQGFFDNLDKAWMIKFVEHRVADRRILRLIQKWLKAGVMEEGKWSDTERGTPQGSVISPLLANIYLRYVFDLWVDVWRRKCARGEVVVVRYADDIVLGFQWETDADRFRKSMDERCGSSDWNCTRIRRAGSSSGGMPSRTGNEEEKASRRPSTSLASRISAGRMEMGLMLCGA
jgi:RNA-directed DNA polymerase